MIRHGAEVHGDEQKALIGCFVDKDEEILSFCGMDKQPPSRWKNFGAFQGHKKNFIPYALFFVADLRNKKPAEWNSYLFGTP